MACNWFYWLRWNPRKLSLGLNAFREMQVACPPVSGPVPQKVCNLLKNALWLTLLAIYFEVYNCDIYTLLLFLFSFPSVFRENLHTVTQFVF